MIHDPNDLSAELRALPTEISPQRDLLPEIEARLAHDGQTSVPARQRFPFRRALAAAGLFAAGALAGRITNIGRASRAAAPAMSPASDFATAAEVQRAGTAYVTALARVAQVKSSSMREQAQESATQTLASVARQLDALNGTVPVVKKF